MKKALLASALLAAVPFTAQAQDGAWTGSGELGLALTTGNSKSQNLNAKLDFTKEDALWKHNSSSRRCAARAKPMACMAYRQPLRRPLHRRLTSSMSAATWSVPRYENDDFSPFDYQWIVSIGYGYTFIKNQRTEFSRRSRTRLSPRRSARICRDCWRPTGHHDLLIRMSKARSWHVA